MRKVAIVIVNYRTPDLVVDCLSSLRQEAQDLDLSVFIGDAASEDGSVETINAFIDRENLAWARCFAIGCNGGFAFGNNAILERCVLPDPAFSHVHFLNPDTYIRPGAVTALLAFLHSHPDAGVAGSHLETPDGSPLAHAFRTPRPWREFFRGARLGVLNRLVPQATIAMEHIEADCPVDWVSGASFMVRRDVLDDIGLMDDGYFLYFEETDFMLRCHAAGHAVWHVAGSRVVHLEGQSTGNQPDAPHARPRPVSPHFLASRKRYMRKHFGPFGPLLANGFFLAGDVVYRVHRLMRARPIENPPHLWRSYLGPTGD